jgi:hypothetical protein
MANGAHFLTRIVGFALGLFSSFLASAQNASPIAGQWMVAGPVVLDRVPVKFFTPPKNISESAIPLSQLRLPLDLVREAGTLHLEGSLQDGSGKFTFNSNPSFPAEMSSLGINDLTERTMFVLAVFDVGATYVRGLNALGVQPRSANQLIGMASMHVTPEYVREFVALGYARTSADSLISMQALGVSPDFVREIEALGFPHPSIEQLISMRALGVTPEYIRRAQAAGLQNPSLDQILNLRALGIVK